MAATVVVNLVVGAYDRTGRQDAGEAVDRHCRWVFPLAYCASILLSVAFAHLYF